MYPADLKYSKDHEWIRVTGDTGRVGITDYAQQQLGDVVYIELPEAGRIFKQGEQFGSVESVKAVSDLFCPVSGQVVEVNSSLSERPEVLAMARELLEFSEAYLRAQGYYIVVANMREPSAQAVAERMFAETELGGLQGPTISRVITRQGQEDMCAVEVVVPKERLGQAVNELRAIGGSGVVVSPVSYIFEEEPERYVALLASLEIQGE